VSRRGSALIEVLVALVILAAAGVSTLAYLSAFVDARARIQAREADLLRADRVLTATALLAREDLDLRLGIRRVGGYLVRVDRPEPLLYRIAVSAEEMAVEELLVTVVFRADPAPGGAR
jgi:type II secretory pathway component PulJ